MITPYTTQTGFDSVLDPAPPLYHSTEGSTQGQLDDSTANLTTRRSFDTNSVGKPQYAMEEDIGGGKEWDEDSRLRMLGYDPILGRPLDMWSATAMNFCHLSWPFEFISMGSIYAYHGPLLFIIGYPIATILSIAFIAPFAEMTSAFPTAGAMATWAWQYARSGVRRERQWAWVVGGLTLAMHLGRIIAYLYSVTLGTTQMYITLKDLPRNPATLQALHPEGWWDPTFYVGMVGLTAIIALTRVWRSRYFWYFGVFLNVGLAVCGFTFIIMCREFTKKYPLHLSFGEREKWPHNFSWMIFLGMPLRLHTIDGPAHMAEETKDPSRAVPKAMYISFLAHSALVYVTVVAFIIVVEPFAAMIGDYSPIVSLMAVLKMNGKFPTTTPAVVYAAITIVACAVQVMASVVVTSRFLFALGRDRGIPFAKLLATTNKKKEPWIAMTVLLVCMFLSTTGCMLSTNHWYNILASFRYFFMGVPYLPALFLYSTSKIDLAFNARATFTIRRWGKACGWFGVLWCIVAIIQGCFPITFWVNSVQKKLLIGSTSSLPGIIAAMLLLCTISWFLYGRVNYIGPIRALTKVSGTEIDPREVIKQKRNPALHSYIAKRSPAHTPRPLVFPPTASPVSPTKRYSKNSLGRLFSRLSSSRGSPGDGTSGSSYETSSGKHATDSPIGLPVSHAHSSPAALAESQALPTLTRTIPSQPKPRAGFFSRNGRKVARGGDDGSALQESQVLPGDTLSTSAAQLESAVLPNTFGRVTDQDDVGVSTSVAMMGQSEVLSTNMATTSMTTSMADHALIESQVLPDDNLAVRWGRNGRTTPTPLDRVEEHVDDSFGHTPPPAQPLQRPPPVWQKTFNEPSSMIESQLEPGETTFEPSAMQESQLEPGSTSRPW